MSFESLPHSPSNPSAPGMVSCWDSKNLFKIMPYMFPSTKELTFPYKLFRIVCHCKSKAIAWNGDGKSVLININDFQTEYLNKGIFQTKRLASFVRQLNLYGFKKVKDQRFLKERDVNSYVWQYEHKYFVKDNPNLLVYVNRTHTLRTRPKKQSNQHQSNLTFPPPNGMQYGSFDPYNTLPFDSVYGGNNCFIPLDGSTTFTNQISSRISANEYNYYNQLGLPCSSTSFPYPEDMGISFSDPDFNLRDGYMTEQTFYLPNLKKLAMNNEKNIQATIIDKAELSDKAIGDKLPEGNIDKSDSIDDINDSKDKYIKSIVIKNLENNLKTEAIVLCDTKVENDNFNPEFRPRVLI
ncbi:uncharacterized protein LOC135924085 [Gordionus sp. m RMFG-2023]|uniref:uncharacterized protein LOC135924085 n=1 Tax=Gordionus sp. m RMFG-2023 TaxID=3053472 RepID=UPI0031FC828C